MSRTSIYSDEELLSITKEYHMTVLKGGNPKALSYAKIARYAIQQGYTKIDEHSFRRCGLVRDYCTRAKGKANPSSDSSDLDDVAEKTGEMLIQATAVPSPDANQTLDGIQTTDEKVAAAVKLFLTAPFSALDEKALIHCSDKEVLIKLLRDTHGRYRLLFDHGLTICHAYRELIQTTSDLRVQLKAAQDTIRAQKQSNEDLRTKLKSTERALKHSPQKEENYFLKQAWKQYVVPSLADSVIYFCGRQKSYSEVDRLIQKHCSLFGLPYGTTSLDISMPQKTFAQAENEFATEKIQDPDMNAAMNELKDGAFPGTTPVQLTDTLETKQLDNIHDSANTADDTKCPDAKFPDACIVINSDTSPRGDACGIENITQDDILSMDGVDVFGDGTTFQLGMDNLFDSMRRKAEALKEARTNE